ncbi:hypothetical protein RND81_13G178300 [Saponaria officinalis]|uniref:S-protein homolog n=1 Tax=Saponaria officinalis TaxID=3572 RepID=A0AAW1H292_SAPOF
MRLIYQSISCLILAIIFAPLYVNCSSWWPWTRYHVSITNWMPGDTVDAHCYYGHDQHNRNIPVYESLTWSFKAKLLTEVRYYCDIYRSNGHINFLAFEDSGDFIDNGCGGRHCFWNATYQGIALKNLKNGEFVLQQTWGPRNKNTQNILT